jgi:hypothetical protein
MMRVTVVAALVSVSAVAVAQPKPGPAIVGATEVIQVAPPAGFVDDGIGGDDTHLAYVVADAASKCELHVVALDTRNEVTVDLAPVMLHAVAIPYFAHDRAFVVGETEDGSQLGALVDVTAGAKKPIVYKLGPATHVSVIGDAGHAQVALEQDVAGAAGKDHRAELYELASGRRLAAGRPLVLDATGTDKALEFRVDHWADGWTKAIGVKGGTWDRKENQRTPDTEATYDLTTNRFVDSHPIADLMEQRKRFQVLADAGGRLDFVHMTWDNNAVQVWRAGKPATVELDQPLAHYDPKSLQGVVGHDQVWIALSVDPVNADAVARKKADVEYLDVFTMTSEGHASRRARVLSAGMKLRFGVLDHRFWVLERSPSFDRGGKRIAVYELQ